MAPEAGILGLMDWKVVLTTFVAVFLAELGDKTQLATLAMASAQPSRLSVLLGAAVALVTSSVLGVLGAVVLERWISPSMLHKLGAVSFLTIGVVMAVRAWR